ncbi:hypothetical protein [Lacinutrix algicola]|uniref:hypothetical protein n=1 Tax=Lacinutrix algicola TaxID=342954 RepID=UPI0006E233D1|nr:hypothetical protein [Lacinutrix algicola]
MKKTILAVLLLVTTVTIAQNNLFSNISTTAKYTEYLTAYDEKGDGVYKITDKRFPVSFQTEYLSTGEGYKIEVVIEEEGNNKGNVQHRYNAIDNYYLASGYPYESVLKHKYKKDGFVSIGNYVILLGGISDDNTSYKNIEKIYVKKGAEISLKPAEKLEEPQKKKLSFFEKVKANQKKRAKAFKGLVIKDLGKTITNYLVAMKAKQDARKPAQLKSDKNIVRARDKGEADIKKYNDSLEKTPEYIKLRAHQAFMERTSVTINNETGRTIYVSVKGDNNFQAKKVWDGGSTRVDCNDDYVYNYTDQRTDSGVLCYTANTACGKSITVK